MLPRVILALMLLPTLASGKTINVSWRMDEDSRRVAYAVRDKDNIEVETFDKDADSGSFEYAITECTSFYLVAKGAEVNDRPNDSDPSNVIVICPDHQPWPPITKFIMTLEPLP